MNQFVWALGAFVLIHIGVAATGLRTRLVGAIGEGPYRGLFSLASLGLLVWLVIAYGAMRADASDPLNGLLWTPPEWGRHVAHLLVFLGFVLGVAGLLSPGPTLAGFEGALSKEDAARGALRITRHPFLWGVALWAAGHLAVNGERFAVMLFGALGVMAVLGARSIDRKTAARDAEGWGRFSSATSNLPFVAIAQGRNRFVLSELWWRILIGAVVFAVVGALHGTLFGAPAFSISF